MPGLIPGMESGIHGLHQPFLAVNQHCKTYGAREHTQDTENHSGIHSCVGHGEGAGVGEIVLVDGQGAGSGFIDGSVLQFGSGDSDGEAKQHGQSQQQGENFGKVFHFAFSFLNQNSSLQKSLHNLERGHKKCQG